MGKRLRDESYYQRKAKVDEMMALDAIDNKFNLFLGRAKSVLDLCASTGGWMQLAIGRRIEPVGLAIGVDLHPDPIRPIIGAVSIQGDITTLECKKKIRKLMGESGVTGFDIVMRSGLSSDPNATLWDQASLITESIKLSTEFLAPDGTFVTKMFDGAEDYTPMLYSLEQLFCRVVVTKPSSTSAETYIVALNYKHPEKINPRLLVARNLFSINEDIPTVKTERNYSGGASASYLKEESTVGRVVLASDFVWSDTPLDVLGIAYSLSFNDDACVSLKNHNLTTKRVKMICKNLRVMDKPSFKHLMEWRLHVRKAMSDGQKTGESKGNGGDNEIPNEMKKLISRRRSARIKFLA